MLGFRKKRIISWLAEEFLVSQEGPRFLKFLCVCEKVDHNSTLYKGKAVPLQAWSDPEGSRKVLFPDFMTAAQDCGKVVSLTHRPPLPPGNTPGTHFY